MDNALIHDLQQLLAEQTRQSAENVTTEQLVEAALLKEESVDDCVVLTRETETSGRELVAYVVTSGLFSPARLQSHLQAVLPAAWVPSAYVPVSTLPLTPTGQVDSQALASLEVIDSDLLQRWSERLVALPEVEQVAVVVQEYVENVPPLHLSDLLPIEEEQRSTTAGKQRGIVQKDCLSVHSPLPPTTSPERPPLRLAISHGGPLWSEPGDPTTLSEVLLRAALQTRGNSIIYLQPSGCESVQSYAAILSDAERILAGLRKLGLKPQDKVIFQLDQNQDIISAFWGCILGGFIPVIIAVPPTYGESNSALDKLFHVWKLLDKPLILTREALRESVYSLSKWLRSEEDFQVRAIEKLRVNKKDNYYHLSQPDDVAFFNLTSGSTGVPKCIMLTHRNILSRAKGTIQLCQHSSEDIILHWLPFDHIASISDWHIRCVYLGCKAVYVSKEYVIGRPLNWLDLIDKYRITHSFAPNFAYSLINDALGQASETQWDLSCVKSLLTAGEAVSASVVEDCQKNLAPYGLKETAIQPAFGMAEFGSGITYFQPTQENHPKFHTVDSSSLGGAVISVSPDHPNSITFTSLGPVIPGVDIRIVSTENILLPEDTVGRLQVKGLAVSPGYYKAPEVNSEVFLESGWFDTGDLGFISKGYLVITGRAKETIIINGVNYYNSEIEAVVEEVEGVDVSYTAACSVWDANSDTEKLAIFFSSSVSDDDRLIKLIGKIQEKVVRKVRVNPAYLIPVEREAIPKTAIGKIQRSQLCRRFEAGEFDAILKRLDILSGNANTLPDWFYRKIWRPKEAMSLAAQPTTGQSLVFLDPLGLGARLCEELRKLNLPCVGVEAGSDFNKLGDNRYSIDPKNPDHYRQLLESLEANDIPIAQVLHLWTYDEYAGEISSPEALESQELGVYSLLFLIQALAQCQGSEQSVRLYVIASHTQPTSPADKIACEKAPVLGLIKTIPQEMPWLDCRHIDVNPDQVEVNAAQINQEILTARGDREVAYRNGQRLVARLEKVDHSHEQKQEIPFKRGGMYLLSGGLGGIGVEIAQYLLKHYQARLLLVGRTELPERSTWETYLEQEDAVSQRIKAYLKLEQLGGEIIYSAVDICDSAQLQQVVDRTVSRWQCSLDGVIHLAGIAREHLLVEETLDSMARVLRPKVRGTWVLHQLLKDKPNSVFISSSSVNGFFGGTGVGAYAAANSFLDCFSHYQRTACSLQSYCFAWSMWDEVGMSRGYKLKELSRARGYHTITAKQGLLSLLALLHHNQAQLLVGLDGSNRHILRYTETKSYREKTIAAYFTAKTDQVPLTQLEALWVQDRFGTHSTCRFLQLQEMPLTDTGEIDLEQLATVERKVSNERVAPQTELELKLASIWQEVLGVPGVGIHDNFFELGGNSLLSTQVISRVRDTFSIELPMRGLFESPTIARLSKYIEAAHCENQSQPVPPLRPVSRDGEMPLSFAQLRLWFLDQLEGGSSTYNITEALKIIGPLNVQALEMAVQEIVRRHEALRTTFPMVNGSPVQALARAKALTLPVVELGLPATQQSNEVIRLATKEARLPFDLSSDPLLRVTLLQLGVSEHVLLLTMHHIVSDGWSMGVLIQELAALYEAFLRGKPSPLAELPIQYADFAHWQRQWLQGEVLAHQLSYWQQQLAGAEPVLELPTDRPRPAVQTFRGAIATLALPAPLSQELKTLSQRSGVTLFMTLLAAFQTLLYRYSGQSDILVGTPIANRNSVEIEGLIGFFANTLVLRTDMKGNPSFRELLARVREVALEAYAHQDLPFEKLVEELQPSRNLSHSPLFQVTFQLLNDPVSTLKLAGLTLNSLKVDSGTAKFDLTLSMVDTEQGLIGALEYNTDLFDATTINRMLGHFQTLLAGIVANPEQQLSDLPLLTAAQRHQLLVEWNETQADYPLNACIHQLFEAQVERSPDAVAVIFEEKQLTYQELNIRANQLAHHLQKLGVGPEVMVGICVERSLEMLVGLLGILKAGGAYVPLDPAYPKERLANMISDSQVKVLLTQQKLVAGLTENQAHVVCLDTDWGVISAHSQENPVSGAKPASLAYVIYTSGSTGRPKGVLVSHRGLLNLVFWHTRAFEVTASDRATQLAGTAFDASVWELWPYLAAGARLYLVESDLNSPVHLRDWLLSKEITISFLPTPLAEGLLSLEWPENLALRIILTGGDQLHQYPSASVPFKVVNNYGPTENTVVTTSGLVVSNGRDDMLPAIGRPIANTQIYILDRHLQPVPIGVPGELHIGGAGLARGYLNSPELTSEKFIPNPFSNQPGARLYKTGDNARYLSDGNIEFLGRIDNQVNIRGFRIELGEIEAVLAQHPTVQQTVVTAREDIPGNKRLVAYVVGQASPPDIPNQDQAPTTYELRRFLKQKLPDYMVPSAFVLLSTLPLTPNGKVDRRALSAPDQSRAYQAVTFMAPRTPIEQQIANIWAQVLRLEQVGIHDNFFELGGHSLLATQVISQLRQALLVELPLRSLFEVPTVAELGLRIETLRWAAQELQAPGSDTMGNYEEGEL